MSQRGWLARSVERADALRPSPEARAAGTRPERFLAASSVRVIPAMLTNSAGGPRAPDHGSTSQLLDAAGASVYERRSRSRRADSDLDSQARCGIFASDEAYQLNLCVHRTPASYPEARPLAGLRPGVGMTRRSLRVTAAAFWRFSERTRPRPTISPINHSRSSTTRRAFAASSAPTTFTIPTTSQANGVARPAADSLSNDAATATGASCGS